jgi:hypothetical protein
LETHKKYDRNVREEAELDKPGKETEHKTTNINHLTGAAWTDKPVKVDGMTNAEEFTNDLSQLVKENKNENE